MDVERVNRLLVKAIGGLTEDEVDEAMSASQLLRSIPEKAGAAPKIPLSPDDGPPPDVAKVKKLADFLQKGIDDHYKDFSIPGYSRMPHAGLVTVKKKRKFILIDQGGSGWLMVGPNNYVWGIKAYGRRHTGYFYGTVDDILRKGITLAVGGTPYKFRPV